MSSTLPKRKHPRLKDFDYSSEGLYFVTICTHNRRNLLAHVGRGLAPADEMVYTSYGKIAEKQLLDLEKRFPDLAIEQYVIMPNHIHVMFYFKEGSAGASPRPTLMDVVCAYKSLTTRECKNVRYIDQLFQTSFYEHVIQTYKEYEEISKYMYENPLRWIFDKLYSEK